jgi:major membrane immunogen (membrane-anchored lipoprotein)
MKKKLLVIAAAVIMVAVLFTGCGGSANQGGSNIKPTTAHLTVIVNDDSGQPVENASVTIGSENGLTNTSGELVFDTIQPGDYTISVEKDGYEKAEKDVEVKAGDQKTVQVTINKKEEAGVIQANDFSKLKSYRITIETKSTEDEEGKILIEQNDFGKEQHIVVYGNKGEVQMELYAVGDKAKIKSGKDSKWMELPSSSASALTQGSAGFVENLMKNTVNDFNETVAGKDIRYSYKRVGRETVNGYPTDKYHLYAKDTTGTEQGVLAADIWIINRGEFKGYTTRMILTGKDQKGEGTFTINLTDINKNINISLP